MINAKKKLYILIFALLVSTALTSQLKISNTSSTYVPNSLPSFQLQEEMKEVFSNDEVLIFLFNLSKPLHNEELKAISAFVSDAKKLENTEDIFSVFDYEAIRGTEDGFKIESILKTKFPQDKSLQEIQRTIETDHFVKDLLIDSNMQLITVVVEPKNLPNSLLRSKYEGKIFDLINKYNLNRLKVAYGGEFAIDMAQFRELINAMKTSTPIVFIIGVFLLYLLFNSKMAVFWASFINLTTTQIIMGLVSIFKINYNLVSTLIPTLIMALTTAFIIHLYNSILACKKLLPHKEAVLKAVENIKRPSFYSALTTGIGFFALTTSEIPPLRNIGLMCGISVFLIYFFTVYVLPSLIVDFEKGVWKQNHYLSVSIDKFTNICLQASLKHPIMIIVSSILLVVILSPNIGKIKSESNLLKFFPEDHAISKSNTLIKNSFIGTTIVNVIFEDQSGSNKLISSAFNTAIDKMKSDLLRIDHIDRVFSATDIIKQLNWAFKGEEDINFSVPKDDNLIEQYLFVYDGEDLFENINRDFNKMKMTINLSVEGANEIEQVLTKIKTIIEKNNVTNTKWQFSGYGKIFSDQENLVIADLIKSVLVSLTLITLVMLLLWRSFSESIMCMIPNLAPIYFMFIVMGLFNIWLDMGTAMVASVSLGIAVDDTIHIFNGIKSKLSSQQNYIQAISQTFNESGRAVVTTTIILVVQFLFMMTSDFNPIKYLGLLTAVGLTFAVLFDLLLLPAIIVVRYKYFGASSKK